MSRVFAVLLTVVLLLGVVAGCRDVLAGIGRDVLAPVFRRHGA